MCFIHISSPHSNNYFNITFYLLLLDIRDDTGVLADSLIDKYLVGVDRRDFNAMIPGLTDVCDHHVALLIHKFSQKLNIRIYW